jgi:4-hydroxyphenylacetate decarboxylase small subunit
MKKFKPPVMEDLCKDCLLYLPVDVFKGMCKLEKTSITPDDKSCKNFKRVPKCKFCANFTAEKEFLGTCSKTTFTYPDLNAVKCAEFKWSQNN